MPTAVALVPARAGSQRVPGKNVRELAGHPLIAYTIAAAHESAVFDVVLVSTDSPEIAEIARRYGAETPHLRPAQLSTATSPDIEWVVHAMKGRTEDVFSILRPTSPFRRGETIRRGFDALIALGKRADSIRAVELCKQHPAKMWVVEGDLMRPYAEQPEGEIPFHSRQYQALPTVYVQNSSLEVAWSRVLADDRSISGQRVAPFFTAGAEGFSIDYPEDFDRALALIENNEAALAPLLEPAR